MSRDVALRVQPRRRRGPGRAAAAARRARAARPRADRPLRGHARHRPRARARRGRGAAGERRVRSAATGSSAASRAPCASIPGPCSRSCPAAAATTPRARSASPRISTRHAPSSPAASSAPLDLGEVDGRPFVGIASLGFDSDANRIANEAPSRLGTLVYVYGALRALARLAARPDFELLLDGEPLRATGYSVAACNSPYYGGGMRLAPDAAARRRAARRRRDLQLAKRDFLVTLPRAFRGTHVRNPAVRILRCRELEVRSSRPFVIYADGDPIGATPATIRVVAERAAGARPALTGSTRRAVVPPRAAAIAVRTAAIAVRAPVRHPSSHGEASGPSEIGAAMAADETPSTEAAYRAAIAAGDPDAWDDLGLLLSEQPGREADAEALYREWVAAGQPPRVERGRLDAGEAGPSRGGRGGLSHRDRGRLRHGVQQSRPAAERPARSRACGRGCLPRRDRRRHHRLLEQPRQPARPPAGSRARRPNRPTAKRSPPGTSPAGWASPRCCWASPAAAPRRRRRTARRSPPARAWAWIGIGHLLDAPAGS